MTNTVSSKSLRLLLLAVLMGAGCTLFRQETGLAPLSSAVRQRMLKVQTIELLAATARERYNPGKAVELYPLESAYQEQLWRVDNDPALQTLENAVVYGLLVTSSSPEKLAERLTGAMLDYGTALRFFKLKTEKKESALLDTAAELAMMTGWSSEEVRRHSSAPFPRVSVELFPLYPDAEELLNKKGNAAAFQTAAELYRTPSMGGVLKAERLRRAMLNRVLMQGKSPGASMTPELRIAVLRSRLFASFLPSL